jgi:hypothetical protein
MRPAIWMGFALLAVFTLTGCDLFVSRGGEGQPCFSDNPDKPCSGDLVCVENVCREPMADGGDGGDGGDPGQDGDGGTPDAGDQGADDGSADDGADDGGQDGGDSGEAFVTHIYRSVGPNNTTPLAEGSFDNKVTIEGTMALFDENLPDNIGVGDTILYDTGGDAEFDYQVFIHGRIDALQFTVANAAGGTAETAPPTQHWAIYRPYTSLLDAIALKASDWLPDGFDAFDTTPSKEFTKDLVARNRVWHIACYADEIDEGGAVSILHWNGDEDRYLHIFTPYDENQVGVRQRHLGSWNSDSSGAYTLNYQCNDQASESVIEVGQYSAVHIEGLQVAYDASLQTTSGSCSGISIVLGPVSWISHNIVKGENTNRSPAVALVSSESLMNMWNNVVFTNDANPGGVGIELGYDVHAFVYNNTVCNWRRGFNSQWNLGQSVVLKNNLAVNNFDREYPEGGFDFKAEIEFSELSSHNCSSDETAMTVAPQSPSCSGITMDEFANPGEGDFHLDLATTEGFGVDLSQDTDLPFTSDIDADNVRPMGDGWDVGADELDE